MEVFKESDEVRIQLFGLHELIVYGNLPRSPAYDSVDQRMAFWKQKNKGIPRVLLIGAGSFGSIHLRILKELASEGRIMLTGVVVRTEAHRRQIETEFGVMCTTRLSTPLLKSVDAVVIATPPETHQWLASRCLPFTDVFVEKPLCETEAEALALEQLARTHGRTLAVGHVYRFHPVAQTLKKILAGKTMPRKIEGVFINPSSTDKGREPSLELLHLYDLVDFLWAKKPQLVSARYENRTVLTHIRYGKQQDAQFTLGWIGNEKKRTLSFRYNNVTIDADFVSNKITISEPSGRREVPCPIVVEPLKQELLSFFDSLHTHKNHLPATIGARIIKIAEQAQPKRYEQPRIAVIGGGIFGTSAALELAKFAQVTLFERNNELLKEGTFINQFRHHWGYHYPRSDETVQEIKRARADFEAVFGEAIVSSWPTYYGLAKEHSLVTVEEFLAFCERNGLTYKKSWPHPTTLARDQMVLGIEVPESNYHHGVLKRIVEERIAQVANLNALLGTSVVHIEHSTDGSKHVTYLKDGKKTRQQFDYVINATYANINQMSQWLEYESRPVRIDFVEQLILELPIEPVSLTVIDGPFATLMPTGNPHEFTLYHVKESILDRYVSDDGLIHQSASAKTNREAILRESAKLFPILDKAKVVESRFVHRAVQAYREHDDARVAELIDHGFGTWSILSGKILSSVTLAKRLATIIRESVVLPDQTVVGGNEGGTETARRKNTFFKKVDKSRTSSAS